MKGFLKKCITVLGLFLLLTGGALAQEADEVLEADPPVISEPLKYALVIGNGAYTVGLSRLTNPVNDANDMAVALEYLGFAVDKVLDGNLDSMETAVIRLKERLKEAENAYGFFFYAGHGVQSGGENFLIPVDANIPSESFLRNRSLSVQDLLDELNNARNSLNVVVLDACRDNPFGWSRSGSRGLAIVSRQPADSIVVYSTSAGQRASDGEGRNGVFTKELLNNLLIPGLEVTEVFRRTGLDVSEASSGQQIPAIYNQFFRIAYLGVKPDAAGIVPMPLQPIILPGMGQEAAQNTDAYLWSAGASLGSSFASPLLIGTLRGTVAPLRNSFIELGIDFGFLSRADDVGYSSFHPYVHGAYYMPVNKLGGIYAGAGGGYMMARYDFPEGEVPVNMFTLDLIAGVNLFSMLDISYTFRTDFTNAGNKISVGYIYRF